jgi:drug/metabolite transporter (DMT)-like permease
MLTWLLIAIRIVANPLSNTSQKLLAGRGATPLAIVGATYFLLSLGCLPLAFVFPPPATRAFWVYITISAVLAVVGNSLVVRALALSDLSLLGPVNAYKAVVGLVLAMPLLGETPGLLAVGGVALIVAGNHLLVRQPDEASAGWLNFFGDQGVQCRFAALVLSAIEAIFLKKAWQASAAAPTFIVWSLMGLAVSALAAVASALFRKKGRELSPPENQERFPLSESPAPFSRSEPAFPLDWGGMRSDVRICRRHLLLLLALATTTGLMQFCTVVVLGELPVGYALALFQISAIVSVLVGHRVFAEPHLRQRLLGSAVMVAGASLVVLGR